MPSSNQVPVILIIKQSISNINNNSHNNRTAAIVLPIRASTLTKFQTITIMAGLSAASVSTVLPVARLSFNINDVLAPSIILSHKEMIS